MWYIRAPALSSWSAADRHSAPASQNPYTPAYIYSISISISIYLYLYLYLYLDRYRYICIYMYAIFGTCAAVLSGGRSSLWLQHPKTHTQTHIYVYIVYIYLSIYIYIYIYIYLHLYLYIIFRHLRCRPGRRPIVSLAPASQNPTGCGAPSAGIGSEGSSGPSFRRRGPTV